MDSYDELFRLLLEIQKEEDKLLEEYLIGNVIFSDTTFQSRLEINNLNEMIARKEKINGEILRQASMSFAQQVKESKEVREYMQITLTNLAITTEVFDKYVGYKTKEVSARNKKLLESRRKLKRYLNDVKYLVITRGVKEISRYTQVSYIEITDKRNQIRIDITTTNLFELFKRIHAEKKHPGDLPYKSSQSLGQVIRHHKTPLIREGVKIFSEKRRGSTHLFITFFLTDDQTRCIKNREEFKDENKKKSIFRWRR